MTAPPVRLISAAVMVRARSEARNVARRRPPPQGWAGGAGSSRRFRGTGVGGPGSPASHVGGDAVSIAWWAVRDLVTGCMNWPNGMSSSVVPWMSSFEVALKQTSIQLGGALGVALLGTLRTAIYRSTLSGKLPPGMSRLTAAASESTLGGAVNAAMHLHAQRGNALLHAARSRSRTSSSSPRQQPRRSRRGSPPSPFATLSPRPSPGQARDRWSVPPAFR
jgi:hypothetical protein